MSDSGTGPSSARNAAPDRWQQALKVLATGDTETLTDSFRVATQAVHVLLGFRYVGVGRLDGSPQSGTIEVADLWDTDRFVGPVSYPARDTPCLAAYREVEGFYLYRDLAALFPDDDMLLDMQAKLYLGCCVRDRDGSAVGHIFAIHDAETEPAPEAEQVMLLIAHWCGREIRHHRLLDNLSASRRAAQQALRKAEEATRARQSFLAGISHELRTPLNAVIGFSGLLRQNPALQTPDRVDGYARDIESSGQHLLGIIDGLLNLSRMELSERTALSQPVILQDVAEAAMAMVCQQPIYHGRAITVDCKSVPPVLGDPRGLCQILINLIVNALKHGGNDKPIAIVARRGPDSGKVVLSVTDQGRGMSPPQLKNALQPFWQSQTSYMVRPDGAGLGLPICADLATAMGADMAVDSTVGVGTTVTVTLLRAAA